MIISCITLRTRESTREVLAHLDYNSVSCVVDLRNLLPGNKYTQEVKVNFPPNVTLVSSTPSQVVVDLLRQVVRPQ